MNANDLFNCDNLLYDMHAVRQWKQHIYATFSATIDAVEAAERRLQSDHVCHQTRQANESSANQMTKRRESDRLRQRTHRANESAEQTTKRRESDRLRHQIRRANESAEQTTQRRASDQLSHQNQRANESLDDTEIRLESQCLRQQQLRANESADNIEQRRESDRLSRNDRRAYKRTKYPLYHAAEQSDNSPKPVYYNVGTLSLSCQHCGALHYATESLPGHATMLHNCCHNGKIDIMNTPPYPEKLRMLFTKGDRLSKRFFEHIRQYNSATAFASFRATMASPSGHGLYSFCIQRRIQGVPK